MAYLPLATVADLEERLGRALSSSETVRADALLRDASATVRVHTGQVFTRVVNDVVTLRIVNGQVRLPQRPADPPTALVPVYSGGVAVGPLTTGSWSFDGLDLVRIGSSSYAGNGPGYETSTSVRTIKVTYSHGYTEIPDAIVGIVCRMAERQLDIPNAGGLSAETIGGYSYTVGTATAGGAPLAGEVAILDRYRRAGGFVRMSGR